MLARYIENKTLIIWILGRANYLGSSGERCSPLQAKTSIISDGLRRNSNKRKRTQMEQINSMPEDDIIRMLRMWRVFLEIEHERAKEKQGPPPGEILKKYHKSIHSDIDYKAELASYRDEKYAEYTNPD